MFDLCQTISNRREEKEVKENKLRARWSKSEHDILLTYPLGISTRCDSAYLAFRVFNNEFVKEMKDRGYDIKTLKFEITVDANSNRYSERFPSLASINKGVNKSEHMADTRLGKTTR